MDPFLSLATPNWSPVVGTGSATSLPPGPTRWSPCSNPNPNPRPQTPKARLPPLADPARPTETTESCRPSSVCLWLEEGGGGGGEALAANAAASHPAHPAWPLWATTPEGVPLPSPLRRGAGAVAAPWWPWPGVPTPRRTPHPGQPAGHLVPPKSPPSWPTVGLTGRCPCLRAHATRHPSPVTTPQVPSPVGLVQPCAVYSNSQAHLRVASPLEQPPILFCSLYVGLCCPCCPLCPRYISPLRTSLERWAARRGTVLPACLPPPTTASSQKGEATLDLLMAALLIYPPTLFRSSVRRHSTLPKKWISDKVIRLCPPPPPHPIRVTHMLPPRLGSLPATYQPRHCPRDLGPGRSPVARAPGPLSSTSITEPGHPPGAEAPRSPPPPLIHTPLTLLGYHTPTRPLGGPRGQPTLPFSTPREVVDGEYKVQI